METLPIYRQIAEAVRRQILQGELQPGDRLPSVRAMMAQWDCTPGTVQHAYQDLAAQGLVISHSGRGTRVIERPAGMGETALRRAALIHRADAFLLEVLTAGYTPADVEDAVRQALNRWRTVAALQPATLPANTLRFAGSHDLAVAWLATHFSEIAPSWTLELNFSGSLRGLIALAEGKADLAGCHLWDAETDEYNRPFVRRLLPGRRAALVTLAQRQIGLMAAPGNPLQLQGVTDLARPGVRFVNRQPGSGTRIWLDAVLRRAGISGAGIEGYHTEKLTHTDVAQMVAEGHADVGLGLAAAARVYGLDFIPLTQERYELVALAGQAESLALQRLWDWLKSPPARQILAGLGGYEAAACGELRWVEA